MVDELSEDWTIYEAAHLLNRAGFGGSPTEVKEFHERGRKGAVTWLLDAEESEPPAPPAWLDTIEKDLEEFRIKRKEFDGLGDQEQAKKRSELQMQQQKDRRQQGLDLLGWWVNRMRNTDAPLQEKMTLFWHDHFPSSAQKVRQPLWMYRQNELFREEALGEFWTTYQAGCS